MKKNILTTLAMVSTMLTATTITSVQDGKINKNSTYNANRFSADTIIIKHAVTWSGNVWANGGNWNVSYLQIDSGGSISPMNNNSKLRLPSGLGIVVNEGGAVLNSSGNNSNHAIIIGGFCVWGKNCCGSNDPVLGHRLISQTIPCGWIALEHRADSVNVFAEMQDGLTKIGSTLSVNMQDFDSDLTIKIFDFSGRLVFNKRVSPISSVDISSISTSGFYILTLEAEGLMIVNRKVYHESN